MDQKEQEQIRFKEICLKTISCQDDECQLNHSRKFVGVCIEYLRNEQQCYDDGEEEFRQNDCNNKNCNLWHFKEEKFKNLINGKTINGIFPHNLCPKSCEYGDCNFQHRKWANNVCLTNIISICRKKNCEFKHEHWEQLKEKAKALSIYKNITPEDICSKQYCDCDKHPIVLKDYCILYLQGLCRNKTQKCLLGNHIDWEKVNIKINQTNSLKSCIVIAQEKKKQIQTTSNFDEVELLCKESELIHYKKWFYEQNIIDVVFIMDLTQSMKPWKEHIEKTIAKIIDKFLSSINGYQVRVAFVGYRDICDKEDKLVTAIFTTKVTELQKFIAQLEVKGGGDYAEDVVSGFEQALKLNFSHHPDSLLCTFLLADAPCHGRDYHNFKSHQNDNQIDEMPKMYFEKVLEKYKSIKKNNFLCCVKINDTTDIMFQKMKAIFPILTITTEKKPEDLFDLVGFTLRMSVTESIKLNTQINSDFQYYKSSFIKLKLDTMTNDYQDANYWKKYIEMIDSMTRQGETGLKVDKNFVNQKDDNSSTYIFKAFDAINNREVIIKIPKIFVDNKEKITSEDISHYEELATTRFYSSCYACQMAYFFNQRLKENDLFKQMQPLFYAHPILYTLEIPFYGMKKVYGETYIQIQYKFEKYTNNQNYTDAQKYFYSAFSHFSFQVSKENLVIMDLQGCNNILSDPSIQTDKSWQSILDKDPTNRQNYGIENFKSIQHKNCSFLCTKLKLDQINQNSLINKALCPPELIKNTYGICYECDEFSSFEIDLLDNVKDNKFNFNCKFCQSAQSEKKIDQLCECCYYMFQTPINQQLKSLTNLGVCQDCKNQCFEKQVNICYYCKRRCQKIMTKININNQPFYICKSAREYLQAFICKKCNKPYNWNSIINKEDYNEKSFNCC